MLNSRPVSKAELSFWLGSVVVGFAAVFYAELVSQVQGIYFNCFSHHPYWISLATPLIFVIATYPVVRFAPDAKGSGIPQVLEAIELAKRSEVSAWGTQLISIRTAVIKVISTTLGFFGGASLGREGPTVQIASSVFAWIGKRVSGYKTKVSFQTFLTAGAAAGVAAAFNTPLAGIAFALEELAEEGFHHFKQWVMVSVIIAGITAQAFLGNYLYFGHPSADVPSLIVIPEALLIGVAGGLLGGIFGRLLGHQRIAFLPKTWWKRALFCGVICSGINFVTHGNTAGSGYEVTQRFFMGPTQAELPMLFAFEKLITTVFSYLSGMAGGIFSPCLSIGAGLGFLIGKIVHLSNLKACGLFGMVAFFSGVVQAPLTAVIIVTEMTDEHILIIPFLVTAFLAQRFASLLMPVPLYKLLAFGLDKTKNDSAKKSLSEVLPDVL